MIKLMTARPKTIAQAIEAAKKARPPIIAKKECIGKRRWRDHQAKIIKILRSKFEGSKGGRYAKSSAD